MTIRTIGKIKALYHYPVKSMAGVPVDTVELGPTGVVGDRVFALRERDGRIVTAKRTTHLLECKARFLTPPKAGQLPEVEIELPDGTRLSSRDPGISGQLSSFLGREVSFEPWQAAQQNYGELDAETIFADVPIQEALAGKKRQLPPDADRYDLAPGTFFDSAHLHLLTTGTLEHLQTLIGADASLDVRRFRPNILIETEPELNGFVEDGWLGKELLIGDHVTIVEIWPTLRCVMTTLPQQELPKDPRILRTIVKAHENHLGVFAATGVAGMIQVGDPIQNAVALSEEK